MKRLPWVGGPSPAKKAPSVGFVYFCVPHETQRLAPTTEAAGGREVGPFSPRGRLDHTLCFSSYIPSLRLQCSSFSSPHPVFFLKIINRPIILAHFDFLGTPLASHFLLTTYPDTKLFKNNIIKAFGFLLVITALHKYIALLLSCVCLCFI